jgi:ABC-type dipeptide/oligopeptide/nickel transport system permease component
MLGALVIVSLLAFALLDTMPGDAASAVAGESASAQQLSAVRASMGLDRAPLARYGTFAANLATRGDLGRSLVSNRPVTQLLLERVPYTVVLAVASLGLAALAGSAVAIAAAQRAGSWWDTLCMGGAALGLAVPSFWSALLLLMVFSVGLRWLPVVGADSAAHLVLPAVTLALPTAAAVARLLRAGLLEVLRADYVRTAHAKGLRPRRVLSRHVLRNSLLPVVTMLGIQLGNLLGGAFIVETIFGWPGLGRLAVQAIFDRDYPVVLGAVLLTAVIYLVINFAVDVLHGWLDPQVSRAAI